MTTALEGGEGSASRPGRSLPQGKTRYPLYRRLGGPQGRSAQVRKNSPPTGIRFQDRPAHSHSLYRLLYPPQCNMQPAVKYYKRMLSGYRHKVDEISAVLGSYAACSGNYLPTLRDNLSVPYSKVKNPERRWDRSVVPKLWSRITTTRCVTSLKSADLRCYKHCCDNLPFCPLVSDVSQRHVPRKGIKRRFAELDLEVEHACSYYMRTFQFC